MVDIGEEDKPFVIEPIVEPIPGAPSTPAPDPVREPPDPVRQPEKVPAPA